VLKIIAALAMSEPSKSKQCAILLALAVFAAAGMVYFHLEIFIPRAIEVRAVRGLASGYSFGADFYPVWLTSREAMVHHRDPYSQEMTRQIQIGLFGCPVEVCSPSHPVDDRAFVHPAFTDVLIWPLAMLPFSIARIFLVPVLAVLTATSIVLWLRGLRLRAAPAAVAAFMILTLSSYPALEGLFAEQLGLIVGFLLAASIAAFVAKRSVLSGSLLALTLIKPQMMVLVAAFLLLQSCAHWQARWPFVAGFFVIAGLLMASSLTIWPRWIPEWLQAIHHYSHYSPAPLVVHVLGRSIGPLVGPWLVAGLLVGALVLAWRTRKAEPGSREFSLTICLLLTITVVALLFGQAVYDHVILLPAVMVVLDSAREFAHRPAYRAILAVTALALFWPWIWAPVVIAARPFFASQFLRSPLVPVRTAASLPFGLLALLAIMAWHGIGKNSPTVTGGGNNDGMPINR
jgi:Glycosyltransferase family 87